MPEKTLRQIICDQVVNISVQGNVLNGINSSVSLKASVSGLRDTKDELAQLLADIINEIY